MSLKDLRGKSRQALKPFSSCEATVSEPTSTCRSCCYAARLLVHANASTRQEGAGCDGIWEQGQEAGGRKALLFPLLMG